MLAQQRTQLNKLHTCRLPDLVATECDGVLSETRTRSQNNHPERITLTEISFEKIDRSSSGGQDAGYVMIVLLLISGVLILFTATVTSAFVGGVGLIAAAVLGYVRLFQKTPKLHYFRYFWLDQDGVHHIEGNSPTDRTAHFTWHDIQSAEASAAGDDFRGLVLTLKRRGMQGVPVLLTMADAEEAAVAIREVISSGHHARSVHS
jgi:hypothetical protein